MSKKLFAIITLCCAFALFYSCVGNDDNIYEIDEEWKAYNEEQVTKAANSGYSRIDSHSGNGSVYWKEAVNFLPNTGEENYNPTLKPQFSDSVHVRYEGWYYTYDGDKYTFDTTEKNQSEFRTRVSSVIDGWTTIMCDMKEGDSREVCIPYMLAYGPYGQGSIPGYTTLWFNIKLLKIIPLDPNRE